MKILRDALTKRKISGTKTHQQIEFHLYVFYFYKSAYFSKRKKNLFHTITCLDIKKKIIFLVSLRYSCLRVQATVICRRQYFKETNQHGLGC